MRYFFSFLFSTIFAILLSFVVLPMLRKMKAGQTVLHYVELHKSKNGTPTMGGIIFIVSSALIFAFLQRGESKPAFVIFAISLVIGVTGFLDDYIKVKYVRNLGLRAYQKIVSQGVLALVVAFYAMSYTNGEIFIPFLNENVFIGYFSIPLYALAFIATVNTVNLTDGLDGLASVLSAIFLVAIGIVISFELLSLRELGILGRGSEYSNILILVLAVLGGIMGFVTVNCFPAKVFMGDTGSLFLGSILSCVAIFTKNVLLIPIFGLPFVVSGVSDILQVAYFKLTKGKRIFRMAPFHHHLQEKGIHESRIVTLYAVVTILVSAVTLMIVLGGNYGI